LLPSVPEKCKYVTANVYEISQRYKKTFRIFMALMKSAAPKNPFFFKIINLLFDGQYLAFALPH
jgi:hypothetical protein